MSQTKIKNNMTQSLKSLLSDAERGIANAGIATMIVAAIVGMTELANRQDQKVLAIQPVFAFSHYGQGNQGNFGNPDMSVRKERDEVSHQSASYGVTMRAHGITGKR
jgi:hypothetical protein